jgi:hypothetical protein
MAVLAAAAGDGAALAERAPAMARVREVIEPRARRGFAEAYLRLVDELERRGWLGAGVAGHARSRAR